MSSEQRPIHSPLGASSAERWMNCPGSVRLPGGAWMEPDEAPEYQTRGTSAHELAALCLTRSCDTWELMGEPVPLASGTALQVHTGGAGECVELLDALAQDDAHVAAAADQIRHMRDGRIVDESAAAPVTSIGSL